MVVLVLLLVITPTVLWYTFSPTAVSEVVEEHASTTEKNIAAGDVPKAVRTAPPDGKSPVGKRLFENGVFVTVIELGSEGFVPKLLEIKAGEEIRFVNRTNLTMHIIADEKTSSVTYRYFNQPNTVGKGGTYQIALTEPGVLFYYTLNSNPRASGVITVLPQ